jgi:hypothetical protein
MTPILVIVILLTLAATANAARPHHSPRYQVAAQLNAQLGGTPLAGHGFALEAAGWKHHVHPAFIAAAAGLESAWGRLACQGNRWNLWGLGSCDRYWRVPHFTTAAQAFDYYARFIRSRWPRARTPYDLAGYCECGSRSWGSRVAWNMERLGFRPTIGYGR